MRRILRSVARGAAAAAALALPAGAAMEDPLAERLTAAALSMAFPGADRIGAIEGDPPVAAAMRDGRLAGYVFTTFDLASPAGYSGEPFDIVVGLDLDGRVAGTALLEHYEPMIGPDLIPDAAMQRYLDNLTAMRVDQPIRKSARGVDGVSGATISSTLMAGAVLLAGRKVARRAGIVGDGDGDGLRLDDERFEERDWPGLAAAGSVARLRLDAGDAARAFDRPPPADGGAPFADLYAALATPADIGRNLFGTRWYNHHLSLLSPGDHLLFLASGRAWPRWRREAEAGRLRLRQDDGATALEAENFLSRTAVRTAGAPRFANHALYRVPAGNGFDPLRPWALEIAVPAAAAGMDGDGEARLSLAYTLPRHLVAGSEAALVAAGLREAPTVLFGLLREDALSDWQLLWVDRAGDIAILAGLLLAVTSVFVMQNALARRRRLHRRLRLAVLAFVLVWLGWMHDAQLSILNVLTWAQAAFGTLDWRVLLVDPLILILSAYVGVSLVLWGRGVFCGWLCPFGALQELANRAGRLLRIPQVRIPETVQEKLWSLKYVAAAAIVAIAAGSMDTAAKAAEIEPFKTAIVVAFDRGWPFVAWALALLAAGLAIERFFCRFLCPLGGALALLGRFHVLHWLRRRPECGNPCGACRSSCPIDAIAGNGAINENECLQCLDCQVDYYDAAVCPPLAAQRRRLQRLGALPSSAV